MARVRRLRTDSTIRTRLGPELLAELRANLWSVDCQTCDRPLGRRPPSLTVAAGDGIAEVALHHRRCQAPRWEPAARLPRFGLHQSWRSGGFAVRGEGLVVFLVNPSCEVAKLVATDTGWRLANLDGYLFAGMEPGWPERPTTLPGLTGSLDGGILTIDFDLDGAPLGRWSTGSLPDYAGAEIRGRDVVLVGVTTAVDVTTGITPEVVRSLVDRRQIALAWAKVRTTPGDPETTGGGLQPGKAVLSAVVAAASGDGSLLAALHGEDRFHAVLQVATMFAGLAPRDSGDGVHIVVPDEPTGQHLAAMGGPVLELFGLTLVRLSAPGSPSRADLVIGTPEQFAATAARGALMLITIEVAAGALPPDFPHRYDRTLSV